MLFSSWPAILSMNTIVCQGLFFPQVYQLPCCFFLLYHLQALIMCRLCGCWCFVDYTPLYFGVCGDAMLPSFVVNMVHGFFTLLSSCSVFMWKLGKTQNLCCYHHLCLPESPSALTSDSIFTPLCKMGVYSPSPLSYFLSFSHHCMCLLDPSGDQYALKMRFVDHVFDEQVIDSLTVKIILPEGAR